MKPLSDIFNMSNHSYTNYNGTTRKMGMYEMVSKFKS